MKVTDIQHKAYLLAMKGDLYWAPIGKPKNVLDIVNPPIRLLELHPNKALTHSTST